MAGSRWSGALLVFAGSFFGGGTLLLIPEMVSGMRAKDLATVWLAYFPVSLFWALAVVRVSTRFRLPLHRLAGAAWGAKGEMAWHFLSLGVVLPVAVLAGGYYGGSLLGNALGQINGLSSLFKQPETSFALLSMGFFLWAADKKPKRLMQAANFLAPCFLIALIYGYLFAGRASAFIPPVTTWPGIRWLNDLSLMGMSIAEGSVDPPWGKVLIVLVLVCYNAIAALTFLLGELACGVNWGFRKLAGVVLAGKALEGVFTYVYVLWLTGGRQTGITAHLLTGMLFLLLMLNAGPSLHVAGTAVQGLRKGRVRFRTAELGLLLVTGFLLGKAGLLVLLIVFGVLQGILFSVLYRAVCG